jgi:hypothetical protein
MHKVGDEIDGHCPRCRLNTYQVVSATDGREVFSATCRTCRNTFPWKPEISAEDQRAKNLKKLSKLAGKKMVPPPEVLQVGRRKGGDLDAPLKALAALNGKDANADSPGRSAKAMAAAENAFGAAPEAEAESEVKSDVSRTPNPTPVGSSATWRQLTASLSWRDGKPYQVTRTYKSGDVVLHKSHGLGIVQSVVHDNACTVLFRDLEVVLQMALPLSALER